MTRQCLIAIGVMLVVLSSGVTGARMMLSSTVGWQVGAGPVGVARFQGYLDDGQLTGVVEFEGSRYKAAGTLESDGSVAGDIEDAGGVVGSFEGTLVEDVFEGQFQFTSEPQGNWVSPSDEAILNESAS